MNPDYARRQMNRLIRSGRVKPPDACQRCGVGKPFKYYHRKEQTRSVFDMLWWCQDCINAYERQGGTATVEAMGDVDEAYKQSVSSVAPTAENVYHLKRLIVMIQEKLDEADLPESERPDLIAKLTSAQKALERELGFDVERAEKQAEDIERGSQNPFDFLK